MNKGEQLGMLLDKVDVIHEKMNQLFLKKGLYTPDLSLLSLGDQTVWHDLHKESKEVSDEIISLLTKV